MIVAVPEVTVHNPAPGDGLFPAKVKTLVLHRLCAVPALAAGADNLFVSTTFAEELAQVPLLTVHLSVALVPAVTPVTVVLYNVGAVIVAVPLTTVHNPVPGEGLLPVSAGNEELLH